MGFTRRKPGEVRDAILSFLGTSEKGASVSEIQTAVEQRLGGEVPPSSVRSYLNLNTPEIFIRAARGHYRIRRGSSG